jgi:transposase
VEVLYERVAGLDMGKKTLTVCAHARPAGPAQRDTNVSDDHPRAGRDAGLAARVRGDGRGNGVDLDLLEAGVYCLEEVVDTWLVNAAHIKAISRRKTDVKDAEWIAQLLECGLLRPSMVPPPDIRRLRMLTRYRVQLMGDRTREITRLELMLEDASIKLSSVAASLTSVSSRAMLTALIEGDVIRGCWPISPRAKCGSRSRSWSRR